MRGSPVGPGDVFLLSPGFNSFRSPVAPKRPGTGEAKYFYGNINPHMLSKSDTPMGSRRSKMKLRIQ
jgi:hypothetical protein